MIDKRRAMRVTAILVCALTVGHVMQSGANAERLSRTLQRGASERVPTGPVEPQLPKDASLGGMVTMPKVTGVRLASLAPLPDSLPLADVETPVMPGLACSVKMTVLPADGAMARLSIFAPCNGGQRVTISHAGVTFAERIGADGHFSEDVPVLDAFAGFDALLDDGRSIQANSIGLVVPDVRRLGVSWVGAEGIHLHAFVNGAKFSDPGHVWAGASASGAGMRSAEIGFVTSLGDPGLPNAQLAEVYTFPPSSTRTGKSIDISIESEISDETCGKTLSGNVVVVESDTRSVPFSVEMPDCTGEIGYLELKNLLPGLKLAGNRG